MKSDSRRRKKRVLNVVELGNDGLVYIRLDDGKKYLLNGDGCWRCGSTADCFGNMTDSELEVICEFDFFDEVRSLFLCLLEDLLNRTASRLSEEMQGKMWSLIERPLNTVIRAVTHANLKYAHPTHYLTRIRPFHP